ncbi:MAG TPA: LysM peptidoglycan-binding domain-containing protein, partial [Candidatus Hydrogenedentes bacterium]|nr:LysM peptidoglycan-binding domain-containing protein [Candidatus Hydrogenedentota bacterium]
MARAVCSGDASVSVRFYGDPLSVIVKKKFVLIWLFFATAGMVLTGCVTRKGPQFEPLPLPEVGVGELEPVKPSSTTELLRAAEKEFKDANAAQEKGDKEAALRHYNKMLQLLIDANLDPVIFYNLRREFSRILDSTAQQTIFFERRTPYQWPDGGKAMPMVMGDLPIPFPLPPRVIQEINEIREVYPRGFQTGLNRSFQYAPYIRAKLAEAGLPQDLFWLAIVESWFNPRAYSRAGAAGMWQFMKDTGRRYGLRIDNYVDERYNWERSTDAAIAYLKDLYAEFGEWPVAIAAYNMGEGGMERAVAAAGGERDIWKLLESPGARLMQEETQKFYPKLVASIIVASSPESYGFTLNPIPPQDYIRVPVQGSYSLAELEKSCGLAEGSLKELNPDLIRGYTPPTGEYPVAVPTHAHTMFLAALETVPKHTTSLWALLGGTENASEKESSSRRPTSTYVVRRGDTLSKIASKFGVTVADLMAANKITSSKGLLVGKRLTIPKTAGSRGQTTKAAADKSSAQNPPSSQTSTQTGEPSSNQTTPAERQTYRVKKGDTVAEIAQKFKVSIRDIQTWNNLSDKSHIRINDLLYVSPPATSTRTEPQGERKIHVVKSGETLSTIASAYNVSLDDLLKWNNLTRKSLIRTNDKLTVYA